MDSIAHRAAVTAASALLATLAFGAGPAPAFPTYCDVNINTSWCGNGENHAFVSNQASYTTDSTNVWVCQRLLYADTQTVVPNSNCNYNLTSQTYSGFFQSEAEVAQTSGVSRVIRGYATT